MNFSHSKIILCFLVYLNLTQPSPIQLGQVDSTLLISKPFPDLNRVGSPKKYHCINDRFLYEFNHLFPTLNISSPLEPIITSAL